MELAERVCDEHNQHKFKWDQLNDLKPLAVTLTTDMAADWNQTKSIVTGTAPVKMLTGVVIIILCCVMVQVRSNFWQK
jgi:hypothetical protein